MHPDDRPPTIRQPRYALDTEPASKTNTMVFRDLKARGHIRTTLRYAGVGAVRGDTRFRRRR